VLSPELAAILQRLKDDLPHYAEKCLRIRSKSGATVPLILNRSQRAVHTGIEDQLKRTGKVRKIVLKGRQTGISTYVGGRMYWRTSKAPGTRAFILTHLDDATVNLFNIAKRFHENCPDVVRPHTGKANAKELSFDLLDSSYGVATAGNKAVGRSDTIQLFHGSEVAFWPNAEEHFAGVMQAVAKAPGTEMILESTANGIGNVFYTTWKRAEIGESDFEPVFIPWFWHEEYVANPPSQWMPPPAWAEYGLLHGLTREQTYWAFIQNRELVVKAGGEIGAPCAKFKQEYPGTANEAFETSGEQAFIDPLRVLRARRNTVEGYGPIILGVDPNRGGKDKCGVIDRQGRRSGGHICKRFDLGDNLMAIAGQVVRIRNELKPKGLKKIAIDITGIGAGVYDRLREQLPSAELEPVNFGEKALEFEKYANRRAEMWDRKRQWYDDAVGVQVPDSDEFQGDECSHEWGPGATHFRSNGQLQLEAKDHVKSRLGYSPDLGDAHALTFAIDLDALNRRSKPERRPQTSAWAA